MKPSCFDSEEQYVLWRKADAFSNRQTATAICQDCTPEYAHRMQQEGRCVHLEVRFDRLPGEGVVGHFGSPGVTWLPSRNRYLAQVIIHRDKRKHLGYFVKQEDAARAVQEYVNKSNAALTEETA